MLRQTLHVQSRPLHRSPVSLWVDTGFTSNGTFSTRHRFLATRYQWQCTQKGNGQRFSSTTSKSSSRIPSVYSTYHPPRLDKRVAIVTGSSSGLGRAIALQYASHGTKLVVCADLRPDPRPEGVEHEPIATHEAIIQAYGSGRAVFVKTDINNAEEVNYAVETAVRNGGRLDVLVNNAGLGNVSGSPFVHELKEEDWDRIMNVNLRGTYITNKYALRQMIKQNPIPLPSASISSCPPPGTGAWPSRDASPTPKPSEINDSDHPMARRGTIINLSSMLGAIALPNGTAAYCASKGGVLNLTKQLALDYAQYKINVNALCPGFLRTAMTSGNWSNPTTNADMIRTTPWGSWGRAEDVARMAVSLASEDAAWMTGEGVVVDGGYSAQ